MNNHWRLMPSCLLILGGCDVEPDSPAPEAVIGSEVAAAPCANYNSLKNLYFGELHNHTSYSLDAYGFGTRTDPATAYAFARGNSCVYIDGADGANGGPLTCIDRPLDFAAVTDHSEWLDPEDPNRPPSSGSDPWAAEQEATNTAYDRCNFTTFNAYEWTYVTPAGANRHHNIIFKDERVTPHTIDARNYPGPLNMWRELSAQCATAGCTALTIPHNSNQSDGVAFNFTLAEIPFMNRFQPLVEIYQHKGASECLSDPADQGYDPYCDFELLPDATQAEDAPGYVRAGLRSGLEWLQGHRTNPLKLGFVGATDNHNATPGNVKEDTWPGHVGQNDNRPAKRLLLTPEFSPGAITAVWAEENTRESIFDAMARRETYATSGPRIAVRFYQYWGLGNPCADASFPAGVVSSGGVPMGGTIGAPPNSLAKPRFVVNALRDQVALARIDIVKLTVDPATGESSEEIIPLDTSGGFCTTWRDDAFDPRAATAYYARVFQQETWRWSHYDCLAAPNVRPRECATGGSLNRRIQERAWTSPIFFEP